MRIVLFIPPNAHGLEIAGIEEVFDEANRTAVAGPLPYEIVRVSTRRGPLRCSCGLSILVEHDVASTEPAGDTLIVGASYGIPEPLAQPELDWLRAASAQSRRFGAVCTGAFILGEAGLLRDRHVTTHWEYAAELAERFPEAQVEPDRIFIRDGPMFSSAGVTAAIDLALDLVEEDLSREIALRVARRLVVFVKRPGGQTQYSVQLAAQSAQREPIQALQSLVRNQPHSDLSLAALASRAGISQRSLSRLFRQETGMTVGDFIEASRLDVARRLLEEGELPLKRIASESGFRTSEALRRAFLRRLGIKPTEYRLQFKTRRRT